MPERILNVSIYFNDQNRESKGVLTLHFQGRNEAPHVDYQQSDFFEPLKFSDPEQWHLEDKNGEIKAFYSIQAVASKSSSVLAKSSSFPQPYSFLFSKILSGHQYVKLSKWLSHLRQTVLYWNRWAACILDSLDRTSCSCWSRSTTVLFSVCYLKLHSRVRIYEAGGNQVRYKCNENEVVFQDVAFRTQHDELWHCFQFEFIVPRHHQVQWAYHHHYLADPNHRHCRFARQYS